MLKSINKELRENLKELEGKDIIIKQSGFINTQFKLSEISYSIKYDILKIEEKAKERYISINLNQMYKIEPLKNLIKIYLDNDTEIEIIK